MYSVALILSIVSDNVEKSKKDLKIYIQDNIEQSKENIMEYIKNQVSQGIASELESHKTSLTIEEDVDQSVAQETTAVPTTPGEAAPADGLIHYSSGYVSPFATDANTRISSDFGLRNAPKTSQGHGSSNHKGIDIAVPVGTKIHSISSGTVINSGPASGYGKWVRVQQDDGNVVTYGHVSNASIVSVGSRGPAVDPNNYLN